MPLEKLQGDGVYLTELNEDWPLGSDSVSSVDDHVRGIKNVLKNTFPNLAGPVTKTAVELNSSSIPKGCVMVFYQKVTPAGWTKLGLGTDYMVRVNNADPGVVGGEHTPIMMDKVPPHTHVAVAANDTHNHLVVMASDTHTHTIPFSGTGANLGTGPASTYQAGSGATTGSYAHDHDGSYTDNDTHTHTITVQNNGGDNATTWRPRYINVMLCRKELGPVRSVTLATLACGRSR